MKRVLYVQHAFALGGSVVSLRELILALKDRVDCRVWCATKEVARVYEALGVGSVPMRIGYFQHFCGGEYPLAFRSLLRVGKQLGVFLLSLPAMLADVSRFKPDLVHLNGSPLLFHAIFFRILGIPVVWHIRENIAKGRFGIRMRWIRWVVRTCASRVIYIGKIEQSLLDVPGVVVPNFRVFRGDGRRPGGRGPLRLLYVGDFFEIKGIREIVEAVIALKGKVVLDCVGVVEDPESGFKSEILGKIAAGGVRDSIRMIPPTLDVEPFFAEADALVCWPVSPHFSRPVFEAWLAKVPVIVSKTCANIDEINSETALIAKGDGSADLVAALKEYFEDKELQSRRALRGHQIAIGMFGPKNADLILKEYESLLKERAVFK